MKKNIQQIDVHELEAESEVEYGSDSSEFEDFDKELFEKIKDKDTFELSVSMINESQIGTPLDEGTRYLINNNFLKKCSQYTNFTDWGNINVASSSIGNQQIDMAFDSTTGDGTELNLSPMKSNNLISFFICRQIIYFFYICS